VTSSSAALVGDMVKERGLGAAMGVFGTIHDTGHALGPILGGFMIQGFAVVLGGEHDPRPFRVTFGIIAALLVVYSILFALRTRRDGGAGPETEATLDRPATRG
jgi:MFS family permease